MHYAEAVCVLDFLSVQSSMNAKNRVLHEYCFGAASEVYFLVRGYERLREFGYGGFAIVLRVPPVCACG